MSQPVEQPNPRRDPPLAYKRVSLIVSVMLSLTALMTLITSWEISGPASRVDQMVTAQFNQTRALSSSYSQTGQNYTLYSYYVTNTELANTLDQYLAEDENQTQLLAIQTQARTLAENNRLFFPARYLNPDGTYNRERNQAEVYAELSRQTDVDVETPRQEAYDRAERKENLIQAILALGVSMSLLGLERLFYWERRTMRYIIILIGGALLVWAISRYIALDPDPIFRLGLKS